MESKDRHLSTEKVKSLSQPLTRQVASNGVKPQMQQEIVVNMINVEASAHSVDAETFYTKTLGDDRLKEISEASKLVADMAVQDN